MLPVTRANLDHICCICLLDLRLSTLPSQKVYDVKTERNISRMLKLTAHITILKNPINQKYISVYCRKICEMCLIKIHYSYNVREKILASTRVLKEIVQADLNETDIEKLQFFCRICLNRHIDLKRLEVTHMNWLKDCSGIRFTSLIDKELFRIKEGTNINEIAVIDDKHFPQSLCRYCLKKLKNVDEFRKSATQSFEYMISVMGDAISQEDRTVKLDIRNFKKNICENAKQLELDLLNCKTGEQESEIVIVEDEKQRRQDQNQNSNCAVEALKNVADFTNIHQFGNNTSGLTDNIYHGSDSSEDLNASNSSFIESASCSNSDNEDFSKHPVDKFEQVDVNERICKSSEEENIVCDVDIKTSNTSKENSLSYMHKRSRSLNENGENIEFKTDKLKETFVCEDCSKEFSSKRSLRKHKGTVHNFDPAKMIECMICFKKFKRKSHMDHHIKSVHEKLKPFKCSFCAKTFGSKSTKREHELCHTGDLPFICSFCGKGFRRSNELKVHLDIHTTVPELLCPICKRRQTSATDLENHLKIHSDKRVQCPLCGKFFSRNCHLLDHHNAVHLKLRPFKCKYCELAFGDRKTRRSHEKMHTEDRPLKCSICSLGFKNQISLTKHKKDMGHIPDDS